MRRWIAPTCLLLALAVLVAQQQHLILHSQATAQARATAERPWPVSTPAAIPTSLVGVANATLETGVTTASLVRNSSRPWTQADLTGVNAFEHAARSHASIVMWYQDWRGTSPSIRQLDAVTRRGSIPEITWEPWNSNSQFVTDQPRYRLVNIIDGRFDSYIHKWARALAAWHQPVLLRFAQEPNGNWYPWDERANDNQPGQFVEAWRHVHDIFTSAGATNVKWVWSPVSQAPKELFPGTRYVDVLGLTCLNSNPGTFVPSGQSFASDCGASIRRLHQLAPMLPIQMAELGSSGFSQAKAAWITSAFTYLSTHPDVTSIIWFDLSNGVTDWTLPHSGPASEAFAAGVQSVDAADRNRIGTDWAHIALAVGHPVPTPSAVESDQLAVQLERRLRRIVITHQPVLALEART